MTTLRKALLRLAHKQPQLRRHLIPLLRHQTASENWNPEKRFRSLPYVGQNNDPAHPEFTRRLRNWVKEDLKRLQDSHDIPNVEIEAVKDVVHQYLDTVDKQFRREERSPKGPQGESFKSLIDAMTGRGGKGFPNSSFGFPRNGMSYYDMVLDILRDYDPQVYTHLKGIPLR